MNWKIVVAVIVALFIYEMFGKQLLGQITGGLFGSGSGARQA